MDRRAYTTAELVEAAGLTMTSYKQMVFRGQLVPSAGRVGIGRNQAHTATDVLQAAFLAHLARLGVGPRRAATVWAMVVRPNLDRDAMILMTSRDDDSDLDVRVVPSDGDDGLDRDDAPIAFTALNLGLLKSRVAAKLDAVPGQGAARSARSRTGSWR